MVYENKTETEENFIFAYNSSFSAVLFLLCTVFGIVYMLKGMSSSTNDLVEGLISQLSEKVAVSVENPSTVIAALTLMENQFNNTLSHLSILLTAFFTVTAFVSIGIPLIERRKTEALVDANNNLQLTLEDTLKALQKEQRNLVLLMHSLYNVSEIDQYDSYQPSIATLSGVTEIDSTTAISKYILGMAEYKKVHSDDVNMSNENASSCYI